MIAPVNSLRGCDFIDIGDLEPAQLRRILDLGREIKAGRWRERPLEGRHVAMLFQKPSNRTRVSFEVGIARLGGAITTLGEHDVQIGVRETVEDAAHVLDEYVDCIVARLRSHADLLKLAAASSHPVVNALTDRSHPCQVLADLMTLEEVGGPLERQRLGYVGDGNNVATSLLEAAALTGLELVVVGPDGYHPSRDAVERAARLGGGSSRITITSDLGALAQADAIYTDVWASMGQEAERDARRKVFAEYRVDAAVMAAAPRAVFMHCLPAHRGEEVADEVIDGDRSVVFRQAGNRLYAQMALMAELFAR